MDPESRPTRRRSSRDRVTAAQRTCSAASVYPANPSAREVVQSTCSVVAPAQRWKIRKDGLLSNGDGTKCLKFRDGLLLEDTSLQMADCQQTWSQQWYLVRRP